VVGFTPSSRQHECGLLGPAAPLLVGSSYISHAKLDKLRSFRVTHKLLHVVEKLSKVRHKSQTCRSNT
jgi:hypothetical protein